MDFDGVEVTVVTPEMLHRMKRSTVRFRSVEEAAEQRERWERRSFELLQRRRRRR